MNGEADSPTDLEMTAPKNQDRWTQEDMLTLLECMKNNLPSNDGSKFKTTESHLDWDKVAFKDFSGEMCKIKWIEISNEVRKFRTLTELIMDAEEHVKNPYKGKKLKKHPDFPKKPLTPYFRFFMEKRAKYAKLHPEMSNLDLTKILSKKYKELPEKKKMKYIQDFQREKQEFERNLARFREDHPDLIQNAKKSDIPEKPKTPQQLWYTHEKKIYLKVRPDEMMRDYIQKHPEVNIEEGVPRSTLTKAERQLKDKFDGRPTKPPPNSYSLYCAELMANMKDVPSTERMVLCSQQWKLLSQKEKDAYHKKCDQRKKDYEIELLRFLESLPEEEQQRVLGEEKMLGVNKKGATSPASKKSSPDASKGGSEKPKRPVSAMFIFSEEKRKQLQEERPELSESELTRLLARMWNDLSEKKKAKYKAREVALKAQTEKKHSSDKEDRGKLPESPKTAEEIWQQSVIGDYLARFKNDRGKALKAMESTWNNMEKKEKLMWIKKAAEDQKRYERELSEMRAPPCSTNASKKMKFQGEPKKPPMNGYQKFSQELLSNGELNHLPLKERMVEIGSRWQRISQSQKEQYKKLAEEQQKQYKVHLDIWLKSLSPQERAVYKEHTSNKRKNMGKMRGPNPKMKPSIQSKSESEDEDEDDDDEEEEEDDDDDNGDSSEEGGDSSDSSSEEESEDGDENEEDDDEEDDDDDEDDDDNESEGSSSSSSSSGDSSDSDSN
ncbi:nucleolar transcription factor 1 isoform X2 [Eublepharis macularius]|uniref:Nucleolar transcription factor 1 n=1 Tax=Eublepharis macularius TaxID=481883 RepID=A0AA97JZH2_EUBMA|nr:nucleolar transcription factor 1 isoform X2 [Eublepharis macularius]